jgi:16S rRNA G966 N2-methylase RsmD
MFVTTAGRTNEEMIDRAKEIAKFLHCDYVHRKKRSISYLTNLHHQDCIVVGHERLELYAKNGHAPFFFHPNSASFRIKRMIRGESDPFLEAARIEKGMSILDCTLGMASDSIVASHAIGKSGKVIGLEANEYVAFLIKEGLAVWNSPIMEMDAAMKRIEVVNTNFKTFLASMDSNSFDCVYFDPMFEEAITSSNGIQPLRKWAEYTSITEEVLFHAKRVAKERIILKAHFRTPLFEQFGFDVIKRPSSKFHYGVIKIDRQY